MSHDRWRAFFESPQAETYRLWILAVWSLFAVVFIASKVVEWWNLERSDNRALCAGCQDIAHEPLEHGDETFCSEMCRDEEMARRAEKIA